MTNAEQLIEALGSVFAEGETEFDEAGLDRMMAALKPLAAPGLEGMMIGRGTAELAFEGIEGLRAVWADWLGAFAGVRFEIENVEEIGANVLVLARQVGTTRHGVEVEQPSAAVWKFRQGRIERIEFHLDREAALASARADALADSRGGAGTASSTEDSDR